MLAGAGSDLPSLISANRSFGTTVSQLQPIVHRWTGVICDASGIRTGNENPTSHEDTVPDELNGKRIAFLVAQEGVEEVELTEPWKAVKDAGATPELIAPEGREVQSFEHLAGAALLGVAAIGLVSLAFLLVGESEERDRRRHPRG